MEARSIQLQGSDSLRLHLREWSDSGVALLLLHGFGNDSHVWDDTAPLLAPHYRTIALDHRGHGDSDADPERRYTGKAMANDVEAVLKALGIERVVLVGHSMGARVAMHFASRHPEHLAGLVLIDSAPEHDPRGTARIRMETESAEQVFRTVTEYEQLLAELYPVTRPEKISALAKHWLRERPDGRFEPKLDPALRTWSAEELRSEELQAQQEMETMELWKALEQVSCPTLVVRGSASDVLSPEIADRMVDEVLPNGTLSVIAQASHSVMLDNPEDFNKALCGFVLG